MERNRKEIADREEEMRREDIRNRTLLTLATTKEGVTEWLQVWQFDQYIAHLREYDGRKLLPMTKVQEMELHERMKSEKLAVTDLEEKLRTAGPHDASRLSSRRTECKNAQCSSSNCRILQ
jgi:hypothetical protein